MSEINNKNYGIVRFEKIKKSNIAEILGRIRHNYRLNSTEISFNTERTKENIVIGPEDPKEILALIKNLWNTCTDKIRPDAVGLIEVLVTSSYNLPDDKKIRFFDMAIAQLKMLYGNDSVVSAQIHFDENTDHMHAFLVPIEKKEVEKNRLTKKQLDELKAELEKQNLKYTTMPRKKRCKKNGKIWKEYDYYREKSYEIRKKLNLIETKISLNAQKIMGSKEILSIQQDMWYENLFKEFGLERGEKSNNPRKNERSSLEKLKQRLEKRELAISEEENRQTEKAKELNEREYWLEEDESYFESDVENANKELQKREDEIIEAENNLKLEKEEFYLYKIEESAKLDEKIFLIKEWEDAGNMISNPENFNWVDDTCSSFMNKKISRYDFSNILKRGIKGIIAKIKKIDSDKIKTLERQLYGEDCYDKTTKKKKHKFGLAEITKLFSEASSGDLRKIADEIDKSSSKNFGELCRRKQNFLRRFFNRKTYDPSPVDLEM